MELRVLNCGVWLISVLFILPLCVGLRIPLPEDVETEYTAVTLDTVAISRFKRNVDVLPDRSMVRIQIAGEDVEIELERNNLLDIRTPVYVQRNGKIEKLSVLDSRKMALYQDRLTGGAFLLEISVNVSTGSGFQIFGTFHHKSKHYLLQPRDGDEVGQGHVVSRLPDETLVFERTPPKVPTESLKKFNLSKEDFTDTRRVRRQTEIYNIEVLTVVDYKNYQFWYDRTVGFSDRHGEAVRHIMEYMSYMMNAVDVRFKSITGENFVFNVLNAGIFIADTASSSPWSGVLDSSTMIDSFTDWLRLQSGLPNFDHAMAFTRYDLTSQGSGDSTGIAFTGALCTFQSTSLVEDSPNFITMTTAAHELGHSLGAEHDGDGNTCSTSENFIMATSNSISKDPILGSNLWKFSSCSAGAFKTFISRLDSLNTNCMLITSSDSKSVTTPKPMAEVFTPDETCVATYGVGSYVCRSIQDYNTICTSMFCNQPGTTQCYSVIPAEGTPCRKGKWCEQGQCVTSQRAPTNVEDNCPLGDRQGLFENTGKTCAEHIAADPSSCYDSYTEVTCCGSCNKAKTNTPDCEYGDYDTTFCSRYTPTSRYGCYINEDYCCSTCAQVKNHAIPGCEFGDRLQGCMKNDCPRYSDGDRTKCCETCVDPSVTVATTTAKPTTTKPTTAKPTTAKPTTAKPTTAKPTTAKPTTAKPTTAKPTTAKPTTAKPTTAKPITEKPTTAKPITEKPTTANPITEKPTTKKSTENPTTLINPTQPETESTRQPMTSPNPDGTSSKPEESKISDMMVIGIGAGAGALVLIGLVVVCIVCRRMEMTSSPKSHGHTKNNSYDNIGFLTPNRKPMHAPPRRTGSSVSQQTNGFSSLSTIENGSTTYVDGYMMPAPSVVSVSSNMSHGVQYAAPAKPNFLASLKNKGLRVVGRPNTHAHSHVTQGGHDAQKRSSKPPVHYKRTSEEHNTNSIEANMTGQNIPVSGERKNSDAYDSIGELANRLPQNRRPTLPENHPGRLTDTMHIREQVDNMPHGNITVQEPSTPDNGADHGRNSPSYTSDKSSYNNNDVYSAYDSAGNVAKQPYKVLPPKLPAKVHGSSLGDSTHASMGQGNSAVTNDNTHVPPRKPVPRRQQSTDDNETVIKAQYMARANPVFNNNSSNISIVGGNIPPMKPVPRRRPSTDSEGQGHMNHVSKAPLKPLKPPLKPVPRRQISAESKGVLNPTFDAGDQEIHI